MSFLSVLDVLFLLLVLLLLLLLVYNLLREREPNEHFPHGCSGFMKFWLTCLETFPENRVYCSYNCPTDWNDGFSDDSQFGKQLGSFELCYQDPNHRQLADFKDREGRYLCWKESQEMCIVSFSRGQPQKMRLCDMYENHALLEMRFRNKTPEQRAVLKYAAKCSRFAQIDEMMASYVNLKGWFMYKLDEKHLDHLGSACSAAIPAAESQPNQFVQMLNDKFNPFYGGSPASRIFGFIDDKLSFLYLLWTFHERDCFKEDADQSLKTFFDELNPLYGAPLATETIKFIDDKIEFLPKLLSSNNSWCFDKYAKIHSAQLQDGLFEKFLENFESPDRVVNGYWIYRTIPTRIHPNSKRELVYIHPSHLSTLQDSLPKSTSKFRANFVIDEDAAESHVEGTKFGGFVKQRTDKSLDHERVRHWPKSTPKCAHKVFKSGNYRCIDCGKFVFIRIHEGVVYVECENCGIGPLDKVYCFCKSTITTRTRNDKKIIEALTKPAAAPIELKQRFAAPKRNTDLSKKVEKTRHSSDKIFHEILSKLELGTHNF